MNFLLILPTLLSTASFGNNRLDAVGFQGSIMLSIGLALGIIAAGYAFYHALRIGRGAIATLFIILGVATFLFDLAIFVITFLPFFPQELISEGTIAFLFELLITISFLFIFIGLIRFQNKAGY